MVREREAVMGRSTQSGWLLLAVTMAVLLGSCGPRRPSPPTRLNPDLAMGRPHRVDAGGARRAAVTIVRAPKAAQAIASTGRSRDAAHLPRVLAIRAADAMPQEKTVAAPVPARRMVVVPAGESILSLVRKLSHRPLTVREEVEVIAQVKRLNPHIFNPDIVRPGTRVVLPGCIGCDAEAERDGGA